MACLLVFHPFFLQARATSGDRDETMEQATRYVYPMGQTAGIKLFSDGVLVVGLSEIATNGGQSSPAKSCGLQEGDIITHLNNEEVNTIEEVQAVLQELAGGEMSMQIRRDDASSEVKTQAVQCSSDGVYKLGAWIRDSMAGIGTLTFYDPDSKIFGALGHGINDIDTTMLMPLQSGSIMPSLVAEVKKGLVGQPGELSGTFRVSEDLGSLYANTAGGVFGTSDVDSSRNAQNRTPVAKNAEVSLGAVTILCNVTEDKVEEFSAEITELFPNSQDTRNLMLRITDPRLLETTGGIVQGMSGSPILQNGKLVGAVTHVLVNDPTKGYDAGDRGKH